MSDEYRRSIPELKARFEFEPSLDDVFVEGSFDRDILDHCLQKASSHRVVYEIDSVDVPCTVVASHQLTSGNKQRVIALARELQIVGNQTCYVCLVDKDLDHWFGELEVTHGLKWTTYCSMELHFFTKEFLEDILLTTARAKIPDIDVLLESLSVVLQEMFVLRLVDRELGLKLDWIPIEKYITRTDGRIAFSESTYVTAVLSKSNHMGKLSAFTKAQKRWSDKVDGDPRDRVRGHDFIALVAWCLKKFKGQREFASEAAIERLLVLLAKDAKGILQQL